MDLLRILAKRQTKLQLICQTKDPNNSGSISKIEFRKILKQSENIDFSRDRFDSILACIEGITIGDNVL